MLRACAVLSVFALALTSACSQPPANPPAPEEGEVKAVDGLILPEGFSAQVAAEGVGRARHIAVRANGDLFVALKQGEEGEGVVALRDEDGDGVFEREERFHDTFGTGVHVQGDMLYVSSDADVYRYQLPTDGSLVPSGPPEIVVANLPDHAQHAAKTLALDGEGTLFVNIGAPSNACQKEMRTPGSPGMDPCPQLETTGGIWRFDADATDQEGSEGEHFATGLRHCVALAWNDEADALFTVVHGRDQFNQLFPEHYTEEDNAELPGEEMHRLEKGGDYGWPYTYWDGRRGERMVSPEYGGDGKTVAEEGKYPDPLIAFPAHWAPNDLIFYDGEAFPKRYRHGAFVAFHGSWNRYPEPQGGYNVVFAPFEGGEPTGEWEVFADGFAGPGPIETPRDARYRPMGLAVAPDGSLYIAESVTGRIWRVTHGG
jgi:glucose/arabinose dehydrogenase